MATTTESINWFVHKLQSIDEGYVLPSIQRPYVWKEKQIAKLFDSILRNFPIGNLMIWRTKEISRYRTFLKDWKNSGDFSLDNDLPGKTKNVILDGQQRLQSLLIGMRGTYNGKSLYFNLLSDPDLEDKTNQGDMAYEFKFFAKQPASGKWISVRELSQVKIPSGKYVKSIFPEQDKELFDTIAQNIETFKNRISDHNCLGYILIDDIGSMEKPRSSEEIVEIFVRANNGGIKLNKSDLLFSLLSSTWEPAYQEIQVLEKWLSDENFEFPRDYILKATLMCIGEKAAYKVEKFKKAGVLDKVKKNWPSIAEAFKDLIVFLKLYTPVKNRKSLVSANSLLPLIAMRQGMTPSEWKNFSQHQAAEYILRTSLARSFNGAKDGLLDDLQKSMQSKFDLDNIIEILRLANRTVDFNSEKIWAISYKNPSEVYFALSKVNGIDISHISDTHIDHIIPKALLKNRTSEEVNQLANLTILTEQENLSKGKKQLTNWLSEMDSDQLVHFCRRNMIPSDKSLWDPLNFDKFIEERKRLIIEKTPLGKLINQKLIEVEDDDENEG